MLLLFLLLTHSIATAQKWVLRPMAIGSTNLNIGRLKTLSSSSSSTSPHVLEIESSFLGPINVLEGSSITIGLQLKEYTTQPIDVPVTIDITQQNSDHKTSFVPVVSYPIDKTTFTMSSKNIYYISIHITDDVLVNPLETEEMTVKISSTAIPANESLYVTLYVTENDVLECKLGDRHKPGKPAIMDDNGFESPDCWACRAGSFSDTVGSEECKRCPLDTFSTQVGSTTGSDCDSCMYPTTTYLSTGNDHKENCMCPEGLYPVFEQPEDFEDQVDVDGEEPLVAQPTVIASCKQCPDGGQCRLPGSLDLNVTRGEFEDIDRTNNETNPFVQSNWYKSKAGYWKIPWEDDIEKKFIKCVDEQLCLDNDICQNKSSGVMCSGCDNGYYKSKGTCKLLTHLFCCCCVKRHGPLLTTIFLSCFLPLLTMFSHVCWCCVSFRYTMFR
jgi:hypothetical protein